MCGEGEESQTTQPGERLEDGLFFNVLSLWTPVFVSVFILVTGYECIRNLPSGMSLCDVIFLNRAVFFQDWIWIGEGGGLGSCVSSINPPAPPCHFCMVEGPLPCTRRQPPETLSPLWFLVLKVEFVFGVFFCLDGSALVE